MPGGSGPVGPHGQGDQAEGNDFEVVEEYSVDIGLLKELRELEKLTAEELGQRVQRSEVEVVGRDGDQRGVEKAMNLVYEQGGPSQGQAA